MSEFEERIKKDSAHLAEIKAEVSKAIVGQKNVVEGVMRAILSNGSVLLEGVPGTAKTMLMRTVSQVMGCAFSRIQFTPDLLPSDILGITAYEKERGFYVLKGPIFSNIVLADEINRAPPKVQSALLEAMQEKQATIGRETFPISPPFFVLATQNPIESLGTYPSPEAQIDRFIYKLTIGYPTLDDETVIIDKNITIRKFEDYNIKPAIRISRLLSMQEDAKNILINSNVKKYITRIVDATRNPAKYGIKSGYYIEYGASPRA